MGDWEAQWQLLYGRVIGNPQGVSLLSTWKNTLELELARRIDWYEDQTRNGNGNIYRNLPAWIAWQLGSACADMNRRNW